MVSDTPQDVRGVALPALTNQRSLADRVRRDRSPAQVGGLSGMSLSGLSPLMGPVVVPVWLSLFRSNLTEFTGVGRSVALRLVRERSLGSKCQPRASLDASTAIQGPSGSPEAAPVATQQKRYFFPPSVSSRTGLSSRL